MRKLVIKWRREGIILLPYLDDFLFTTKGFWQFVRLACKVERDSILTELKINVPKCHSIPSQQRRQLGFDVNLRSGKFKVPADRWVGLKALVDSILAAKHGRVQARRLASVVGTVMSMHLSWGPVTQLYSTHVYTLIDSVW